MNIFCFGDSITAGFWDDGGGWADRLKRHQSSEQIKVYNLGVSGQRSDHLVKRLESEIDNRQDTKEESIVLIEIGANDATYLPNEKKFKVNSEEFAHNLAVLVRQALGHTPHVVLLTITPVNENATVSDEKVRLNTYVDEYNSIIKKVAEREGASVLDINDIFQKNSTKNLLCVDGLHPNTAGHSLIFESVLAIVVSEPILVQYPHE